MIGYPHYPSAFISDKIEKQEFVAKVNGVPGDELAVYLSFSKRSLVVIVLLAVLHWIFVGKNLIFIIYTSLLVDLGQPACNLKHVSAEPTSREFIGGGKNQDSSHLFTKFACLVTNCTRLTPNGREHFANDLIRLPVFAICASHMRSHLSPLIYTHLFGLIATCSMALFVFILSSLVPLWCYCRPIPASFLLDVLCPRTAHMRAHQAILSQLETLLSSQVNFCNNLAHFPQMAHRVARHLSPHENDPRAPPAVERSKNDGRANSVVAATCYWSSSSSSRVHLRQDSERRRAIRRLDWFRTKVARTSELDHEQSEQSTRMMSRALGDHFDSFLADCLPVNVSAWFRINWTHAFMLTVALAHGSVSSAFGSTMLYALLDYSYEQTYTEFARQTRLDKCQFWRLGVPEAMAERELSTEMGQEFALGGAQAVELDQLVEHWTAVELAQLLGFMLGVPTFILVMATVHFHHATNLFNLTIADLKLQLMTLTELTELLKCSNMLTDMSGPFDAHGWDLLPLDGAGATPMLKIRAQLYEQIERVLIFWIERRTRTKLEARLAHQKFALKLLLDEMHRDFTKTSADGQHKVQLKDPKELLLNLLERLHINYRLFMDTFAEYHEPVTTCFVFGYLLNYGFALIGLYWFKKLKDTVVLPLVLACLSLVVANCLIVLCSRVHAAGRKLEVQFWSLVGLLTNMEDSRAKHLRQLWVRQLWLIDSNGGLALRMFGKLNVTYVAIIQSVLWTSSLLLFTYTRTSVP